MNSDKLFNIFRIAFPATFVTTVVVVPTALAVAEHNRNLHAEFQVEIKLPEGSDIEFSNTTATIGQDFETDITSSIKIQGVNVTVGDSTLPDEAIVFTPANEQHIYNLKILGSYITSKQITIDVISEPVVEPFKITFNAGEGTITGTGQSTIDMNFDDQITWANISNKPGCSYIDHVLDGWTLIQGSQTPIPDEHLFNSNETVYAIYSDCEHEFDKYWIEEDSNPDGSVIRRVHGRCSICGDEDVTLTDTQLQELVGSFLVKNADGTFTLITNKELSFYVGEASSLTEFDIYPIWGTYEINTSRSILNQANVRLHGINDSNGNITSALDSYNNAIEGEGTEGSIYYNIGISLYLDNMILQGRNYYDTYHGWSGGIQATYLSCEYCALYGEMATYSPGNVFKHCRFDSTNITGSNTDYSIYCYAGSVLIEDCSFVSNGKAIKLYNGQGPHLNEIYDCTFTIVNHRNDKAAIEIDPTYCSASNKCVVYYDNISLDETYAGLPLYHINTGLEGLVELHPNERRT